MTAEQVKQSRTWPKDVGTTEDVVDRYCPKATAYLLLRERGPALYVTNPGTTEITALHVLPFDVARDVVSRFLVVS